jgi:hypothetical protein
MSQYYRNAYSCEGSLALKPEVHTGLHLVDGSARSFVSRDAGEASRPAVDSLVSHDGIVNARQKARSKRLAICLSVMFVLFSALSLGIDSRNALVAHDALSSQQSVVVTVGKGDTLWGIAQSHSVAGASTNDVLAWIKNQNHLATSSIQAGQTLIVPSGLSS